MKAGALLSVRMVVSNKYIDTANNTSKENIQENIVTNTIKVRNISTKIGRILKVAILKTAAKDWDPFETILMILPVSRLKWKARDYL